MTPDAETKVRMALAEAGYPNADVSLLGLTSFGEPKVGIGMEVPPEVAYQAYIVVGEWDPIGCFECWNAGETVQNRCIAGDCSAGGP